MAVAAPERGLESQRLGPAWFAVCTAAGVDPNRYRVWIHEGPEATAPPVAGSTVAVTNWSALVLPTRNLEAVLAHELAHRLALPRPVSLIVCCLSIPARLMGKALRATWKQPVVGFLLKVFFVIYALGIIGIWAWWGFTYEIVFLLSPLAAPFVVPAAARTSEMYADRIALDLGYGPALAEVFTGREYQRAQTWAAAPQQGMKDSQPLDLLVPVWMRRIAMLGIALIAAGCDAGTAGQAFVAPESSARSGMSIAPGTTAVIGLGDLQLADPGKTAKLVSLSVAGDQVGAQAGHVLGVKVYRLTDSGGIGAITEADLSGVDGNGGWQLEAPAGAFVTDGEPLGVAVLVQGEAMGTWSSDSFVVEYTIDGRRQTQRFPLGAGLCVVTNPDAGARCDP
ncbi:hypothetical protein [Kribbella sp. NBC_00359]|uniref:hypothetical protein n=1 Tax=Kribbella sp. NBC_00359 TaxID=2975966 RepID=UPI002E24A538